MSGVDLMYGKTMQFVVCCLLLAPSLLLAQETVVAPGTRVRINEDQVGELVTWDEQRLVLDNATFSASEVDKLEVSLGTAKAGNAWATGLAIGAGVGFVSGFVLCAGDRCHEVPEGAAAGVFGLAGGALGAIVGLVVGSSSSTEQWGEVALRQLQVGIASGGPVILVALRL